MKEPVLVDSDKVEEGTMLTVDSMVHGRIKVPIRDCLIIGRSITSDLVLADAGLLDRHVKITVQKDGVWLKALGDAVKFDGGCLQPNESRLVSASCGFSVGGVPMSIELPDLDPPLEIFMPERKVGRTRYALVAAAVVLAVGLIGGAAFAMAGGAGPVRLAHVPAVAAAPIKMDAPHARELLLAELPRRGLTTISIDALPEGSNRAQGTITPNQRSLWAETKLWADTTFGGAVLLVDQVTVAAKGPNLAIQSAWVGDVPYVIDGNGDKLFIGAVLAEGWIIDGIEAGRVLLRRQAQRMAVKF